MASFPEQNKLAAAAMVPRGLWRKLNLFLCLDRKLSNIRKEKWVEVHGYEMGKPGMLIFISCLVTLVARVSHVSIT